MLFIAAIKRHARRGGGCHVMRSYGRGHFIRRTLCPGSVRFENIYNKSAIIINRIATNKPYIYTIVETWNDSADCSSLAGSTSPDYGCLVRARLQSMAQATNIQSNNVGVCLPYMYGDV